MGEVARYQPIVSKPGGGRAPAVLSGTTVIMPRCNPYGHETGGPKRLEGGMYGPEYEGKYKWVCARRAAVRVRMVCELRGHRGQIMHLCRPHAIEIQKRQSELCPRCAWPPQARSWNEVIMRLQNELAVLYAAGQFHSPRAATIRSQIEGAGHHMTELMQNGTIRKVALRLVEVS